MHTHTKCAAPAKTKQSRITDYFAEATTDDDYSYEDELSKYYAYMNEKCRTIIVPTVSNVRKRFGYAAVHGYRLLLERAENSGANFATEDLIRLNAVCMKSRISDLEERVSEGAY